MAINSQKLGTILQSFVTTTSDVEGAALVSPDGLPIAARLPSGMDEERTSAMSAAMLSLGERIGVELSTGAIERLYVEGSNGYGILMGCGEEAVLLVLATKSAKQGLLMLEIKRTVVEIKSILTS